MARLFLPVTKISSVTPAAMASSTAYWIKGLSTTGSISLGMALVAGKKRVPIPATGKTALRIGFIVIKKLKTDSDKRGQRHATAVTRLRAQVLYLDRCAT